MKTKKPTSQSRRKTLPKPTARQAFAEHLRELRRRLYYCALAVFFAGCAIYFVQMQLVDLLLKPSHGQHFIYTSPIGGIDFLFKICIYGGIVLALPVIVYNFLRFIEPVLAGSTRRFIVWQTVASSILALAGMAFGYFIGLPAALHFLLHQFTTIQIQPLVTIQSYLSFVIVYMVGSAMLFQLPLLLLFINRIRPLKPRRLFHYERWVILIAFILAGLMNPTPNILSQLLIAGPIIIMYQVGIGLIALINRRPAVAEPTLSLDDTRRLARYMIRRSLRPVRPARQSRLVDGVTGRA
jgi:sec-independent protein translocase protein TatC